MSLTSYRAAPPRGRGIGKRARGALVRFGGDLLSHVLGRSTIGAAALNGRVRDGIGCFARAFATKPEQRTGHGREALPWCHETVFPCPRPTGRDFRLRAGLPASGSDRSLSGD